MNDVPLKEIPIKVDAGLTDLLPDFIWNHNAGPLENLFRLVNIPLIMFSGGTFSMILVALSFLGWDLSDLGRMLDKTLGLKTASDLTDIDPNTIIEHSTNILNTALEQKNKTSGMRFPPLVVLAADWESPTIQMEPEGLMDPDDWEKHHKVMMKDFDKQMEELVKDRPDRGVSNEEWAEKNKNLIKSFEDEERAQSSPPAQAEELSAEERKFKMQEEAAQRQQRALDLREQQINERMESGRAKEEAKLQLERERMQLERERESRKENWEKQREEIRQRERTEDKSEALRKEEAAKKEMRAREKASLKLEKARLSAGRGLSGGGKAALGLGLAGLVGWVWKLFTDKSSWLSRALRGGAAVAADAVNSENPAQEVGRARHVNVPQTTTNYQAKLQQVIDDILQ